MQFCLLNRYETGFCSVIRLGAHLRQRDATFCIQMPLASWFEWKQGKASRVALLLVCVEPNYVIMMRNGCH
ncbi:hypothetical protein LSTR_LSTR017084 [Laodelphax striatellus]|uniref:Uncharacterized protein n=1 Tax=Laodelphax striatellus TaxID=195883 RepID=A0A482X406_LAOST|nr:hypothetical protein LSTR_LSTR017084 [Laodelphax striatellus]